MLNKKHDTLFLLKAFFVLNERDSGKKNKEIFFNGYGISKEKIFF